MFLGLLILCLHSAITIQMSLSIKKQDIHMVLYSFLGILFTSSLLVLGYNKYIKITSNDNDLV